MKRLFLIFFIIFINCCSGQYKIYRDIITGANFSQIYSLLVSEDHEYVFEFRGNTKIFPARVEVRSPEATKEFPVMIVAQQQKSIQSWQIPNTDEPDSPMFDKGVTSHTLCPQTLKYFKTESTKAAARRIFPYSEYSNPTVIIKSLSTKKIPFELDVNIVEDFFLKINQDYVVQVTGNSPVYHYFNFYDNENTTDNVDAVLVAVTSKSQTCMLFSIQNSSCPVFDLENNIKYDSYWQTMSENAALVVTRRHYPNGFFVVMTVKRGDDECSKNIPSTFLLTRRKTVTLRITPTITIKELHTIVYATLGFFAIFLVLAIIGGALYFIRTLKLARQTLQESNDVQNEDEPRAVACMQLCFLSCDGANRNASNYVWLVAIVILFYILPVLQIAATYQGMVNDTGNDDICYYNFLCALPQYIGIYFTDFNHILSNIGYVFLGIVFIILTHLKAIRECTKHREGFGLMKPYGMYYALGISLVMEGIMSACYHICPKKSNFQFDTSFMYVMTVLMIVNVYEIRKNDASERKRDQRGYMVFFILAGITAISVIGSYTDTKLEFWIFVTILHTGSCFIVIWIIENEYIKNIFQRVKDRAANWTDMVHGILLLFINMANIGLAIYGIFVKNSFATYVLTILITNGVLYTMFYIIMKVMHNEKIVWKTLVLIVLAIACWIPALYFFHANVTTWEETPAQSRNRNQECFLVQYYDTHDIWHFLSAFALFFTCWILLTLDEGLQNIPRGDIVDFHRDRSLTTYRDNDN